MKKKNFKDVFDLIVFCRFKAGKVKILNNVNRSVIEFNTQNLATFYSDTFTTNCFWEVDWNDLDKDENLTYFASGDFLFDVTFF